MIIKEFTIDEKFKDLAEMETSRFIMPGGLYTIPSGDMSLIRNFNVVVLQKRIHIIGKAVYVALEFETAQGVVAPEGVLEGWINQARVVPEPEAE